MSNHRVLSMIVCATGFAVVAARAELIVTLEPLPGSVITGAATVVVEAFVENNGPDARMLGYQIDLPCSLIGKAGSTGEIFTQPAAGCTANTDCPSNDSGTGNIACAAGPAPRYCNSLSIGNTSKPASGAVPWMFACIPPNVSDDPFFCLQQNRPIAQRVCRLAGAPGAGEPPFIIPAGVRRYLGTFRYEVSLCASGTFEIPYEVLTEPCQITDLTRIVNEHNECVSARFVSGSLTVETGGCCTADGCLAEAVNATCCSSNWAGRFIASGDCIDNCVACTDSPVDYNFDHSVDLGDFAAFQNCLLGAGASDDPDCSAFDTNPPDDRVIASDYAEVFRCLRGP